MTKTPGESPGSSSFPPYSRPGLALLIAACGFAATLLILTGYPGLRLSWVAAPGWMLALLDLAVINLPLVLAVLAAVVVGSSVGVARATGIRIWRWSDLVLGLCVGFVVRAIVELIAPTTGNLAGPFGDTPLSTTVVVVIGVVLISPYIEEWFFRGLVLRAAVDALGRVRGFSRLLVSGVAIIVSTGAFASLHFATSGGAVSPALLIGTVGVGLGCSILTVITGRIGAAIVAHVVFNAVGVGLLLV